MKNLILLCTVFLSVGCTTSSEVERLTNGSSAKEALSVKTTTSTPVETPVTNTTTITVPAEPESHAVHICYFRMTDQIAVKGMPTASVKLEWSIVNADESRTRLDASWVPSTGYAWVQIPVGPDTPFRLVAHGTDGSVDIKLILAYVPLGFDK
jgi:hypothetical protein